jgi:hypothetical protein
MFWSRDIKTGRLVRVDENLVKVKIEPVEEVLAPAPFDDELPPLEAFDDELPLDYIPGLVSLDESPLDVSLLNDEVAHEVAVAPSEQNIPCVCGHHTSPLHCPLTECPVTDYDELPDLMTQEELLADLFPKDDTELFLVEAPKPPEEIKKKYPIDVVHRTASVNSKTAGNMCSCGYHSNLLKCNKTLLAPPQVSIELGTLTDFPKIDYFSLFFIWNSYKTRNFNSEKSMV